MYGKLMITMTLRTETGLHIGGSDAYASIGAVNNPIIRDPLTGQPFLPGSSLKGKMRSLLVRATSNSYILPKFEEDPAVIRRIFGDAGNQNLKIPPKLARLQFADAFLSNAEQMHKYGGVTEIKVENTITRGTSVANPRQVERVIRGAEFFVRLIYNIEEVNHINEDFETIALGLELINKDYLGGQGSRGSGRVSFKDVMVAHCYNSENLELENGDKVSCDDLEAIIRERTECPIHW